MKKVLYYFFGAILFIIGTVSFLILVGEPTEESVYPYLMKAISLGVLCVIVKITDKLGYFDDDDEI